MNKLTELVREAIASSFPFWTAKETDNFARFLVWYFREQTNLDGNYVIQIPSHLFEYAKRQVDSGKKQWEDIRPGYLRKALENWSSVAQEFKNFYSDDDLRKINSKKKPDLEAIRWIRDSFKVVIPDFDLPSSVDKILNFINHIDRSVKFTSKQVPVWFVMKEVAEELAEESVEVFWEEVELRCLENNIHMSPENWRQMKKRILDRINAQARGSKDMLHMVSTEELALRELLDVVERLEMQSQKKAYRFSEMELTGMVNLKKLFSRNHYTTDRFPDVYDGDIPARSKEEQELIDLGGDGIVQLVQRSWTDALGVYCIGPLVADENQSYEFTTEGYIVVDTKKIEEWVEIWNRHNQELSLTVPDVQFVVLMHELGHWLSHWASRNGKDADLLQWNPGFEFPNNMTREALANIICLWACEDIDDEKQRKGVLRALDALTPKNENGDVDTSNAYGAYKLIEGFNRSGVLEKLNAVRANWMLKDEFLFNFLESSEKDVLKWLDKRKPETVSLENYKKDPSFEHKSVWDQGELAKGLRLLHRLREMPKRPN